jgi:DnaJ-class molecular chaperone
MADDYYKTLGVSRNASQADIQKAYRELARKYHPDMNPEDPSATKKFQQIQAAFDVLGKAEKREMYDRYGSSFETHGAGGPHADRGWAGAAGPGADFGGAWAEDVDFGQFFGDRFGGEMPGGLGDIFAQFRRAAGQRGQQGRGRSARARQAVDITSEVEIPFTTSITGGQVQLTLHRPTGKSESIVVKVPPGIEDGKTIRLRGQGEQPSGGGSPGNLLLKVRVRPHPFFARRGSNLYVRLPVTLGEAVAGAKIDVPTPTGTVALRVPPCTSGGTKFRIKGHGVALKNAPPGDLLAEVQIVLPSGLSEAERNQVRQIDQQHPFSPRQDLRW